MGDGLPLDTCTVFGATVDMGFCNEWNDDDDDDIYNEWSVEAKYGTSIVWSMR